MCPPPPPLEAHGKGVGLVGGAKVVFIIPLPSNVLSACCKDTNHVSNRLSGELAAEFSGAEKSLLEASATGERTGKARLLKEVLRRENHGLKVYPVDGSSAFSMTGTYF